MADRKLGAAYVEIITRGMDKVKAETAALKAQFGSVAAAGDTLKKALANITGKVTVDTAKTEADIKRTTDKIKSLKEYRDFLFQIGANTSAFDKRIAEAKAKLAALQGTPARPGAAPATPGAAPAAARPGAANIVGAIGSGVAGAASALGSSVQGAMGAIGTGGRAVMSALSSSFQAGFSVLQVSLKAASDAIGKLEETLKRVGTIAAASFAAGSGAITRFVASADPRGWMLLQGTLGAISVQLGNIFLPILDKVSAGLERVLGVLRGLTNEQRDQIVRWTEIAGAIALGLAILPRVISLLTMAGSAMRALAVVTGVASGGIIPILGVLAAAAIGLGLFAKSADEGKGFLEELVDTFKPLIDAAKSLAKPLAELGSSILSVFADFGKELATVFKSAIEALAPLFQSSFGDIIKVVKGMVESLRPILLASVGAIKAIIDILIAVFKASLIYIKATWELIGVVFKGLAPILADVVKTIANLLASLKPIIEFTAQAFAIGAAVIAKAFEGMWNVIEPILKSFANHIQKMSEIIKKETTAIQENIENMNEVLGTMGTSWSGIGKGIGSFFGKIFDGIAAGIRWIAGLFTGLLNKFRDGTAYIAQFGIELAKGNFTNPREKAQEAADYWDNREKQRKKEREDAAAKTKAAAAAKAKAAGQTRPPGRHAGQLLQKPELIGFAELWRKAMTATNMTPELRKQQEILDSNKDNGKKQDATNKLLGEIAGKSGDAASDNGYFMS